MPRSAFVIPAEVGRIALWPKTVNGVATPRISLDGAWKFTATPPVEPHGVDVDFSGWSDVQVPGELALQGFDIQSGKAYPYKRAFLIPRDYQGSGILLRFESVHSDARVWVNGAFVGGHCGPATVWDCDITRAVTPGAEAVVTVEIVDRVEDPSILSRYARHNTGGILRSVTLMAQPAIHLSRLHIDATLADDATTGLLGLEASVSGADGGDVTLLLDLTSPEGKAVPIADGALDLGPGGATISLPVSQVQTWDAEHPRLYTLSCRLMTGAALMEEHVMKIGFRRIVFGGRDGTDSRKLYVNGRQVKLRGVDLHDYSWDKGRVTTPEMNGRDIAQLKSCNVNYVRTSHYPPPRALVEACDRLGMYLEVETAVCFQHGILDQAQIDGYVSRFVEMVEANRNHPSVLIWSLGNESSWNEGISAEYDWIKTHDPTRPVKFSWPQTIFEEHAPMDIFSIHYVHFMDGFNATHDVAPGKLPCLHDEIAHVPCNNLVEMRRDPNIHNFWGESIKRHWEEIYATDGALGCAIWEAKDDIFYLPDAIKRKQQSLFNDTSGMGGWGCIWDSVGRLKPEAWLVKKAYSPVVINQRSFVLPERGSPVGILVRNRFDHTNLSELQVEWHVRSETGRIGLPNVAPGESGSISLPIRQWRDGDEIALMFYTSDGVMVEEYRLIAGSAETFAISKEGPSPIVRERDGEITLSSEDVRLIVDTSTGTIREYSRKGVARVTGGPHLHLTGVNPGPWRLDENGLSVEQKERESVVSVMGAYGALKVRFRLSLSGNGVLSAGYEVLNQAANQRELSEVGLSFDLPDTADRIRWQRRGLWTAYPEDHIGRNRGLACRARPGAREEPDRLGIPSPWPWKDDMRDFYAFRSNDEVDGWATNDFRSMKEHVEHYAVGFSDGEGMVEIVPQGDMACRMSYGPGRDPLVHASDEDVSFDGPWERIPLMGYNGSVWVSKQAGASATLTFDGVGVRVYGLRQAGAALMRVLLDGKPWAMVDPSKGSTGAESTVELLCEVTHLPEARHTLKVTVADSHGGTLGINVFEVRRTPLQKPRACLIANQEWNYPQLDWGNFVRPSIRLEKGMRGSLNMRFV